MAEEKTKNTREQEQLMATMGLIINGGNAKSLAFEAIYATKEGDFTTAHEKLQEASGNPIEVHLLTVHSQDHLMNAITFRDLAGEVVAIHEELAQIKARFSK